MVSTKVRAGKRCGLEFDVDRRVNATGRIGKARSVTLTGVSEKLSIRLGLRLEGSSPSNRVTRKHYNVPLGSEEGRRRAS